MQTRRDSKQLHGFKTTTKRCKNLPQTDKATDTKQPQTTTTTTKILVMTTRKQWTQRNKTDQN